ncbi:hypothetical protein VW35_12390 [Devosia soli]|uniref:SCP domain-containing protein n=1 Tax=Devosia soli TaxID=361041 RepID=A0A0F5L8H3_9HYPH|nr:CAP domain-containing protein [Devosia soli]KKB77937.1 hypothetical protein VW35_12390 [Devosia soli]
MTISPLRLAAAAGIALTAGLVVTGCSMMGGGGAPTSLASGLTARMDRPGAVLDKVQAVNLVNAYRATRGVAPLTPDAGLDGTAQALANQYAQTGTAPATPQGLLVMKLSAGYATFAETFSGWRNSPADASGLAASATKAGVAAAYNATSGYGVYWVLVLAN